jgi:SAM-dependent methyltransferase
MVNWLDYFTPEFEPDFYGAVHADLRAFNPQQLWQHYEAWGRGEGRRASRAQGRQALCQTLIHAERALEIGPFYTPLLQPGPKTFFLDVLDHEGLKQRGIKYGFDISRVPPIDFVSSTCNVDVAEGHFDLVVSSHAIEHTPSLVHHLQSVERKLVPGGIYALLVPDYRYCFDRFLSPSNIAQVLDAWRADRTVHTLEKVIENGALLAHNDSWRHWQGDHGERIIDPAKIRAAISEYDASAGSYIDVHNWQFTAQTFREIIDLLGALDLIKLRAVRVYDAVYGSNEFSAILIR